MGDVEAVLSLTKELKVKTVTARRNALKNLVESLGRHSVQREVHRSNDSARGANLTLWARIIKNVRVAKSLEHRALTPLAIRSSI